MRAYCVTTRNGLEMARYSFYAERQRRRAGGVVDFYIGHTLVRRFFGVNPRLGVMQWAGKPDIDGRVERWSLCEMHERATCRECGS